MGFNKCSTVLVVFLLALSWSPFITKAEEDFVKCTGEVGTLECRAPPDGSTRFPGHQFYTCVTHGYALKRSAGNVSCPLNAETNEPEATCLISCADELLGHYNAFQQIGSDSELFQTLCACQLSEIVAEGTVDLRLPVQTSLENLCYSPEGAGNCSWYQDCFSSAHKECRNAEMLAAADVGEALCHLTESLPSPIAWISEAETCLQTNLVITLRDFAQPVICEVSNTLIKTIMASTCFPAELPCDTLPSNEDLISIVNFTLSTNLAVNSTSFLRRIVNAANRCHGESFWQTNAFSHITLTLEGHHPESNSETKSSDDFSSTVARSLAIALDWHGNNVAWFANALNETQVTPVADKSDLFHVTVTIIANSPLIDELQLLLGQLIPGTNYTLLGCQVGSETCQAIAASPVSEAPIVTEMSTTDEPAKASTIAMPATTTHNPLTAGYMAYWNENGLLPTIVASGAFQVQAILIIADLPVLIFNNGELVAVTQNLKSIAWRGKFIPPSALPQSKIDIFHAVYDPKSELIYANLNQLDNAGIFWIRRSDFDETGNKTNSAAMHYLIENTTNTNGFERRFAGLGIDVENRLLFSSDYSNGEINVWLLRTKGNKSPYDPEVVYLTSITAANIPTTLHSGKFYPSFCAVRNDPGEVLLAVSDSFNNIVYLFKNVTINGTQNWSAFQVVSQMNITKPGAPASTRRPSDLTFDINGFLYVTDFNNYRIQIFEVGTNSANLVWVSPQLAEKPLRIGTISNSTTKEVGAIVQLLAEDLLYLGKSSE